MMPAMMLSGFATPVQNMPDWLQPVAHVNPLTHFLVIVRGVFLRDMPIWLVAAAHLADGADRRRHAVGGRPGCSGAGCSRSRPIQSPLLAAPCLTLRPPAFRHGTIFTHVISGRQMHDEARLMREKG